MPVSINITGDNASHAVQELCGFVANMHTELTKLTTGSPKTPLAPQAAPPCPSPQAAHVADADVEIHAVAPKSKAKAAAKAATPAAPAPQEVELPEHEDPTLDNARAWIQAVNSKLGLDPAAKIITSFGVKKVGEIDASKFGDFIAKCKAVLTGGAPVAGTNVADMM